MGAAYNSALTQSGMGKRDFIKALRARAAGMRKQHKAPGWAEFLPPDKGLLLENPFVACKDIVVHVCQQRVCVDQNVPIDVEDIWAASGTDGSLSRPATNRFSLQDEVHGSSTWNWTYHRHSQTHDGQIGIWCGTELVEPATVHGIGIVFEHLLQPNGWPQSNGGCGHGDTFLTVPDSWGRAKMYSKFSVRYRMPGGGWVLGYDGAQSNYLDTGEINSNVSCWVDNILGAAGGNDILLPLSGTFPAGTEFLVEGYLSYWIKALGEAGDAYAYYNMRVRPYIKIESCSYQYPSTITINVADYAP